MRKNDTSVQPVQGTGNAQTTSIYDCLTRSELIQILESNITEPLSASDLYRCAMSAVCLWCDDVVAGRFAALDKLNKRLRAIADIYEHKRL